MKRVVILLIGSLLTIMLSGCAVFQFITSSDRGRDPQSVNMGGNLILATLQTDHYCYESSEPILVNFTLENVSADIVMLGTGEATVVDVIVYNDTNQYFWSKIHTESLPVTSLQLEPGEIYEIEWSADVPSDIDYTVKGIWLWEKGSQSEIFLSISRPPDCLGLR
jgi:hypothetical protein